MTGFLTIEDINGTLYRNQGFYWHEINTAVIGDRDFSNVKFDFCTVSRETRSDSHPYKYTFIIDNENWTNGYYAWASNGLAPSGTAITGGLQIVTTRPLIKLYLYVGPVKYDSLTKLVGKLEKPVVSLNLKQINTPQTIPVISWDGGIRWSFVDNIELGLNEIVRNSQKFGFLLVNLIKSDFQFQCNQSLTVGKVNKVYLGANVDYKPNGDFVGEYTPSITVDYNGETLPVTFDGTDYYFNLDLTDKTETGKVRFTVNVESNEVLNSTTTDVALNSQYQTVNTFDALLSAVGISDVIRLGANLTATANIPINRSVKIIGNDKTINLDSYRFVLKEDVEFKAENVVFNNGDTTIIQAKNTKIELTQVTFNNCTSTNYNGLGSCIFCDVDVDSLDVTNDYITTLTECTFTDNANCILHGGELTIQKCTLTNNHLNNHNKNNVAFVYQTDGTCLIQNSNIELDYRAEGSGLCSDEETIGFAQAIIMCGETANINGASHSDLQNDNTLPFFELPFNNRGYLNVKYYYPSLEACVQSLSNDNGCCHACSGVDWVFKNNVTVRRSE